MNILPEAQQCSERILRWRGDRFCGQAAPGAGCKQDSPPLHDEADTRGADAGGGVFVGQASAESRRVICFAREPRDVEASRLAEFPD